MMIKFVIVCMVILQMLPQTFGCLYLYIRKTVCELMSIMSFPCHLVSCNAVTSSRYCFSCDSNNKNAPVLNCVRTFHVLKVKSFSYTYQSLRGFSEVFTTSAFLPGEMSLTPNPQPSIWRTRVSLYVWVIAFDLSGMGSPTSNCATAGIALRTH
jgi:hypothetical protein